jgi:pyruvate kinase
MSSSDVNPTPPRGVKIVCTLGPATSSAEAIGALVRAGMNVARLNFSHGRFEEHAERARLVRAAAQAEGRPVALLQDLRGPKVRIGAMEPGTTLVTDGDFALLPGVGAGNASRAYVDDALFFEEVRAGDRLLLADGAIQLEVLSVGPDGARCRVAGGGPLSSGKGVNVPRGLLRRPVLAEGDIEAIGFGARIGVDLVGVSYVRSPDDLKTVRRALREVDASTPVVAKIETAAAIANLDAILEATDAVLVARGDLSLETPFERVPMEQKRIIEAARRRGRPVITATQMLMSMVREPFPTRAEVNDVANAVLDGTDAVMLSEETAVGAHPARAVEIMARIVAYTEESRTPPLRGAEGLSVDLRELGVGAEAAARTARELRARAVIAWSRGGLAARLLSRASPGIPIVAPTPSAATARMLTLVRDVTPIEVAGALIDPAAVRKVLGAEPHDEGNVVVFGHELDGSGRRMAWMRVARLDEPSGWMRDPKV